MSNVIQNLLNNLLIFGVNHNYQLIVRMLNKYSNAKYINENDVTVLTYAVKKGYVNIVKLLVENRHGNINHFDSYGETALSIAIKNNNINVVRVLLVKGRVNANQCTRYGVHPLIYAVKKGNLPIVELLLAHGAVVEHADCYGATALIYAAENGHLEIVELLLANLVDLEHVNHALLVAVKNGHLPMVELLLANGAVIHNENQSIGRLLFLAIWNNKFEMVELLLDKGANLEHANEIANTALIMAVEKGNLPIVELLLANLANLEHIDKFYDTSYKCLNEKIKTLISEIKTLQAKILLDTKKIANDINQVLMNETNDSSLEEMELKIISILNDYYHSISKNKNVSSKFHQLLKREFANNLKFGEENYSLLHIAVFNNWPKLISYLINNWSINVDYQDSSGTIAWNHACMLLQPQIASLIKPETQLTTADKEFLKNYINLSTRETFPLTNNEDDLVTSKNRKEIISWQDVNSIDLPTKLVTNIITVQKM